MPEEKAPVISILENMGRNIEQKKGLFDSYAHQSIDIIESYQHIRDFEEIKTHLETLMETQLSLIEQLRERNKSRIPGKIDQESAVVFFELILRVRNKNPKAFEISDEKKIGEIVELLREHNKAVQEGDIGKASTFARRINSRFNQFNSEEYGLEDVETECYKLRKRNVDQQKLMKDFIMPSDIFSEMRKDKIDVRNLTEVPADFKGYIDKNRDNSNKIRRLLQEEKELYERVRTLVLKYFKKSDIAIDIIRRILERVVN